MARRLEEDALDLLIEGVAVPDPLVWHDDMARLPARELRRSLNRRQWEHITTRLLQGRMFRPDLGHAGGELISWRAAGATWLDPWVYLRPRHPLQLALAAFVLGCGYSFLLHKVGVASTTLAGSAIHLALFPLGWMTAALAGSGLLTPQGRRVAVLQAAQDAVRPMSRPKDAQAQEARARTALILEKVSAISQVLGGHLSLDVNPTETLAQIYSLCAARRRIAASGQDPVVRASLLRIDQFIEQRMEFLRTTDHALTPLATDVMTRQALGGDEDRLQENAAAVSAAIYGARRAVVDSTEDDLDTALTRPESMR